MGLAQLLVRPSGPGERSRRRHRFTPSCDRALERLEIRAVPAVVSVIPAYSYSGSWKGIDFAVTQEGDRLVAEITNQTSVSVLISFATYNNAAPLPDVNLPNQLLEDSQSHVVAPGETRRFQ